MRDREETKTWVKAVLTHLRVKPTELARRIGKAPSTINRFLNDPGAEHNLSDETIFAIAEVSGLSPLEYPSSPRRAPGFYEPEAQAFDAGSGSGDTLVDDAVRNLVHGRNAVDPWILRSRAVETVGYLPGDILIVDMNERPRPRDLVCAQVFDWAGGKAETVFRLYEPPYLIAATGDARLLKPFVVDDDVVIIRGVVISSLRPRRNIEVAA
jgi:transcriptional regulator with XRE-family HTH domain